uniref:MADS57 n=1 Tax=Hippophae rhamnoides TaxID=193516 RepID=A0AAU7LJI7_9ROSA
MGQCRGIAKEALDRSAIAAKFLCLLHVYGPSMLPTLNMNGDVVLAEHVSHRLGKVYPGDVVLVRSPLDPKKTLTKRVAVEGDRVTFFVDPMSGDRWETTMV